MQAGLKDGSAMLLRAIKMGGLALAFALRPSVARAANDCAVDAAVINFGQIDVLSGAPTYAAGGPITINCTGDDGTVNVSVGLDAGSGSGATVLARKMTLSGNPAYQLSYSLFKSGSYTDVWGDPSSSPLTSTISVSNNSGSQALAVYGVVSGGQQGAHVGEYSDYIGINVLY